MATVAEEGLNQLDEEIVAAMEGKKKVFEGRLKY
jgi:hypothetical protein